MVAHGTEHQVEKRITNLRADQIAAEQRLYDLEQELKGLIARLTLVEQALVAQGFTLEDDLTS